MSSRIAAWLVTLFVLSALALGVFLLIYAKDTPAPGLILTLGSAAVLLYRLFGRNSGQKGADEDDAFIVAEQNRDSYQYEVERRRRGEFDTDVVEDTHRNSIE
jgi:hypothetical protein